MLLAAAVASIGVIVGVVLVIVLYPGTESTALRHSSLLQPSAHAILVWTTVSLCLLAQLIDRSCHVLCDVCAHAVSFSRLLFEWLALLYCLQSLVGIALTLGARWTPVRKWFQLADYAIGSLLLALLGAAALVGPRAVLPFPHARAASHPAACC